MTPLERDREFSHKALLRYLKACGFRLQPNEDEPAQQRLTRRKTTVEFAARAKRPYAYTLRPPSNGHARFATTNPFSIMTRVEGLLEEPAGGEG
jgi:hypothetical protein